MDVQSTREQPRPGYPTRREFLAHGAAVLLVVAGCGRGSSSGARAAVAPIFEHGEGRGADGCVVMSPPVFLSEEEAMQVLRDELARQGIELGEGMTLDGVEIKWVEEHLSSSRWLGEPRERRTYTVALDAVDRKNRVGIEFISHESYDGFGGGWFGSVASYDTKGVATRVADEIRQQATDDLRIGVFYDPLTAEDFSLDVEDYKEFNEKDKSADTSLKTLSDRIDKCHEAAKRKSALLLRRQARDFATWLKHS